MERDTQQAPDQDKFWLNRHSLNLIVLNTLERCADGNRIRISAVRFNGTLLGHRGAEKELSLQESGAVSATVSVRFSRRNGG